MIFNLDYRYNVQDIMLMHNIMTVKQIEQLETVCFVYKYSLQMLPKRFNDFLQSTYIDQTTKISTQSSSTHYLSFCKLNVRTQRFKHKGTIYWNISPSQIKGLNTHKNFTETTHTTYYISNSFSITFTPILNRSSFTLIFFSLNLLFHNRQPNLLIGGKYLWTFLT